MAATTHTDALTDDELLAAVAGVNAWLNDDGLNALTVAEPHSDELAESFGTPVGTRVVNYCDDELFGVLVAAFYAEDQGPMQAVRLEAASLEKVRAEEKERAERFGFAGDGPPYPEVIIAGISGYGSCTVKRLGRHPTLDELSFWRPV